MAIYMRINVAKLPDDAAKVLYLTLYFKGRALKWIQNHLEDYLQNLEDMWSDGTRDIFSSY